MAHSGCRNRDSPVLQKAVRSRMLIFSKLFTSDKSDAVEMKSLFSHSENKFYFGMFVLPFEKMLCFRIVHKFISQVFRVEDFID